MPSLRDDPLPPAFDVVTYRARNPDLPLMSDPAAEAHYAREGRAAGRVASPLAEREGLLAHLADARRVLEIGPFNKPLLSGPHVEYLDMLDAGQLRARAIEIGEDPAGCPAHIHHVGDLARIDRRFDAIVSSHAIEHQPDLVRHLREIERLLEADGACYLIIPDKRFCFDHFLPESTIAQVLQAWSEARRSHNLASIVEHMALTTHNDAARHWAGDHGNPARGRDARLRAALERYARDSTTYVDVHAWQFTPDSFRAVIDALAGLSLIGLEIDEVYDTPHGRHEFCAVLRLSEPARVAKQVLAAAISVLVLQTADPVRYAPMLAVTQRNVTEYCRRHGFAYEAFVGISRGFHAWQASYNRIPLMQALIDRGYRGWVLYLDADAYVADLDFDLASYLARHQDRGAIIATSGVTGEHWDVNDGVMLVNLGHPQGRRLVERWNAKFSALDDDRLHAAEQWIDDDNDQDLLHQVLREDAAIADAVRVESLDLLNSRHARFIRQHLRVHTPNLAERIRAIAAEIGALDPHNAQASEEPELGRVWSARLAHPLGLEPELVEAPPGAPIALALAQDIIARWRHAPADDALSYQRDLAAVLAAGDAEGLRLMLAELGRTAAVQGVLGGARQHQRASDKLFARRLALSTYDRLVSLAEAVGARDIENPEMGPWGENSVRPPADLFSAVERALDADLTPPAAIGAYLGIAVGGDRVMHPRMLDAIHAAWRLRTLGRVQGLDTIVEIGGGVGLAAFYARRMGLGSYRIVATPLMSALQAAVVGDASIATASWPDGATDILFDQDSLPDAPRDLALSYLRAARAQGCRLFLSINPDGRTGSGGAPLHPVRDLVADAGGWRAVGRHRHWLRAGHVEEIWLAE